MAPATPHPPDSDPPAPRRRPTIVDVARRAGVSAAAVSFAVNDRPGVSSGTRERILIAARELGWQPSASARALTEARTRAVGLVLARDVAQLEGDSFFVRFLVGIQRALTAADYALLLQIVPGEASSALPAFSRLAAEGRVDGFLLTDVEVSDPRFAPLQEAGIPVVLAGRPGGRSPFPCVETRHEEGIAPAVSHLVALGHERIAFLGGRGSYEHVRVREAAWRAALAAAGLEPGPVGCVEPAADAAPPAAAGGDSAAGRSAPSSTPPVGHAATSRPADAAPPAAAGGDSAAGRSAPSSTPPVGHAATSRPADARSAALALLRREPTAIVCSSDALAIEAIAAARSAGLSVPEDVSVVGFDDSALAAFAAPALTSVRVDYSEFGEAAALALLACITGDPLPEYAPLAPELVVRGSTGRVPPRWRSGS